MILKHILLYLFLFKYQFSQIVSAHFYIYNSIDNKHYNNTSSIDIKKLNVKKNTFSQEK